MFNKNKSPAPSPQPRPTTPAAIPPLPDMPSAGAAKPATAAPAGTSSRGLSTLSSDLKFEGTISGAGDLQVDGQIKGDLRVGRLIVGETGAVEGNVSADYIEVRGRIVGATSGKQVKLVSTAYVDGDITAEQLSIDIGAYFQGRCVQGRRDAPAATAPKPVAAPAADLAPVPQQPQGQVIDMKPH
ncbi:bactofilin family protein [Brevundimonas sp.]|uniref:bactofilin family protein n=1 Tax=Brevundimonas sp. TaxID=1871086 RepID=UPI003A8E01A7